MLEVTVDLVACLTHTYTVSHKRTRTRVHTQCHTHTHTYHRGYWYRPANCAKYDSNFDNVLTFFKHFKHKNSRYYLPKTVVEVILDQVGFGNRDGDLDAQPRDYERHNDNQNEV